MSIPGSASPLFIGAAAVEAGYQVDRSLRFSSDDSAYLSRTPSSAGNRKTWTWSGWVKRSSEAAYQQIFSARSSNTEHTSLLFWNDDAFVVRVETGGTIYDLKTSQVFRDFSAWYHFLVAVDTTQATAANRVKIYINGSVVSAFSTASYPPQNTETYINSTSAHDIGRFGAPSNYFDGYLTEIQFVDGQALAPTDFGEYDSSNTWQPKEYAGNYGPATNQSETWSDESEVIYTAGSNFSPVNVFDANTGNYQQLTATYGTFVLTYDFGTSITDLKIDWYFQSGNTILRFNGDSSTDINPSTSTFSRNLETISSSSIPASVTSITIIADNVADVWLYGIYINGELLIDSGLTASSNGFHLDFSDNTSTTTIAEDSSGNNNDWTANNISVASGAGNDSLIDTPTNYTATSGNNGGNYCTLNPLEKASTQATSNGNLQLNINQSRPTFATTKSTFGVSSGKFYWEFVKETSSTGGLVLSGVWPTDETSPTLTTDLPANIGSYTDLLGFGASNSNNQFRLMPSGTSSSGSYTEGQVIGIAFDADAGKFYAFVNGSEISGQNISAGTTVFDTVTVGKTYVPFAYNGNGGSGTENVETTFNFGQRAYAFPPGGTGGPPSGYKSLCTTNLSDPTIADGSTAMDVVLYAGDGNSTQTITGLNFAPDLTWQKIRNQAGAHALTDSVRGVSAGYLRSESTNAESGSSADGVSAFTSDGFTAAGVFNSSSNNWVTWAWDAGTSTVSNTDGSITSNVRANQSAGFSIVTHTGNGTNPSSVGHGLNSAPVFYITKSRDSSTDWVVSTTVIDGTHDFLDLNNTQAAGAFDAGIPTSSVFYVSGSTTNANGDDYVTYCWSPVSQYSSFGVYTGNGSNDGPFVFTGFRPAWLLIKNTIDGTDNDYWVLFDTTRSEHNLTDKTLIANLNNAEGTTTHGVDILSNGFKLRATHTSRNASGDTYIYAAFAEHPFKTARAR